MQFRTVFCTALNAINNYNDWFSRLPYGFTNVTAGPAQHLYRTLCNREPPPLPPPPFTGGQCVGVLYNVTSTWQNYDDQGAPIAGATVNWNPTNLTGPITFIGQTDNPTTPNRVRRTIRYNGGASEVHLGNIDTSGNVGSVAPTSINVVRSNGAPDTCGDPPPIIPPPSPTYNDVDIDFTYNDNSSTAIDISGNFTFGAPTLNFNGDISVPVRIDIEGSDTVIDAKLNVNGPLLEFNFGSPNYSPSPSPSPDDYETGPGTPDVPDDVPTPITPPSPIVPEPETRQLLRGVIVTVTNIPDDFGLIFQEGNPDIYIPNLGYVNFLIATGNVLSWSVDLAVKNRRCFIPCPWEGGRSAGGGHSSVRRYLAAVACLCTD